MSAAFFSEYGRGGKRESLAPIKNGTATDAYRESLLEHPNDFVKVAAAGTIESPETISKHLKNKNTAVLIGLAKNPNLTSEHIDSVLDDPEMSPSNQNRFIKSQNVSEDNLLKGLKFGHEDISWVVASHPKATKAVLTAALKNDQQESTQMAALRNYARVRNSHYEQATKSKYPFVAEHARNVLKDCAK